MLFANNIVVVRDLREELNEKLELGRQASKDYGFHINRSKTVYEM